jgi:endonuclease/exonuclease/phosphatase family metal-dependent hydrolase
VRIRVVTYNVHGFRGGFDEVAATLTRLRPDVLCLQECGSRRTSRRLAAALGMELVSSHRPFGRVRNAVAFALPWQAMGHRVQDLSSRRGSRRRGFVAVTLSGHGMRAVVVSVHLGLNSGERVRHVAELAEALQDVHVPTIVGADMNEDAVGLAVRRITRALSDAYAAVGELPGDTFPARGPTDRIDYVFTSHQLRATGAWVPSGGGRAPGSDHLPVVVDLELD